MEKVSLQRKRFTLWQIYKLALDDVLMLTKKEIKVVQSLSRKKGRVEHGLFLAEGAKLVKELISSGMEVDNVFVTTEERDAFSESMSGSLHELIVEVSDREIQKISLLSNNSGVVALVKIPDRKLNLDLLKTDLTIALDAVRDPGNFGTIIRTADWFGIKDIFCSEDCVDVYNPKVVQATMGSIARVRVYYLSLEEFLGRIKGETPIYAATMNGESVYEQSLSRQGVLIMGNEGVGISEAVMKLADQEISIPSFGKAESLNVAMAMGILCSEFRRG